MAWVSLHPLTLWDRVQIVRMVLCHLLTQIMEMFLELLQNINIKTHQLINWLKLRNIATIKDKILDSTVHQEIQVVHLTVHIMQATHPQT